MPSWDVRHAAELPVHPPGVFQIRLVLAILSVAAFVVTLLSGRRGAQSRWAYLTFGFIVAMFTMFCSARSGGDSISRLCARDNGGRDRSAMDDVFGVRAVVDGWVSGWRQSYMGLGFLVRRVAGSRSGWHAKFG